MTDRAKHSESMVIVLVLRSMSQRQRVIIMVQTLGEPNRIEHAPSVVLLLLATCALSHKPASRVLFKPVIAAVRVM